MERSSRQRFMDGFLCAFILGIDYFVKWLALQNLVLGGPVLVGTFSEIQLSWTLVYNQGAAWGFFAHFPHVLLFVRLFFVGGLFWSYFWASLSRAARMAITCIVAGAIGNIIDMISMGHVVDMIQVTLFGWEYPVFNVADISICSGVFLFVFDQIVHHK